MVAINALTVATPVMAIDSVGTGAVGWARTVSWTIVAKAKMPTVAAIDH